MLFSLKQREKKSSVFENDFLKNKHFLTVLFLNNKILIRMKSCKKRAIYVINLKSNRGR